MQILAREAALPKWCRQCKSPRAHISKGWLCSLVSCITTGNIKSSCFPKALTWWHTSHAVEGRGRCQQLPQCAAQGQSWAVASQGCFMMFLGRWLLLFNSHHSLVSWSLLVWAGNHSPSLRAVRSSESSTFLHWQLLVILLSILIVSGVL